MGRQETKYKTAEPLQMVGGFPSSSQHIPPLCPPPPVAATLIHSFIFSPCQVRCRGQICRHRRRDHQGLPQKVLAEKQTGGAGKEEERRGPLEVDLEARGGEDVGFRPIKSNDVVGRENQAAARISPEASLPSSVSSSAPDSRPRGRGLAGVSSHIDASPPGVGWVVPTNPEGPRPL